MANVRYSAYTVLYRVLHEDAYSAIALNHIVREEKLAGVDVSFLSALVYGVLERKLTLEYIIRQYSSLRIKKIEPKTLIVLYLGVYQLIYMDKVPDSAAVNESVKLCKKLRLFKSAGFVNAVLRNLIRADKAYRLPDKSDTLKYLSVIYSCPEDVVRELIADYGGDTAEKILTGFIGRPPITVRVNTLKTDKATLCRRLKEQGIGVREVPYLKYSLMLSHTGSLEKIPQFQSGQFFVEDAASQLCAEMLGAKSGERIADVCAAPGGKSFTAAQYMENRGKIYAFDIYEHKLRLIEKTASRLGISIIKTDIRDAQSDTRELELCDKVLCDVPCSGLGILSRKPEIRYKKDLLNPELSELQYKILTNTARFTAYGGTLIYSTCTLNPAENTENVKRFLSEYPEFKPAELNLGIESVTDEPSNCLTLFPFGGTDGFFIAKFKREKNA